MSGKKEAGQIGLLPARSPSRWRERAAENFIAV
jgi:hypothetical protein